MPPVAHGDLVTDRRPTGLSLPQQNAAVVECDPVRGVRNGKQNAIAAKPTAGAGEVPGPPVGDHPGYRWKIAVLKSVRLSVEPVRPSRFVPASSSQPVRPGGRFSEGRLSGRQPTPAPS